jgi:hypothetical protein
MVSCSAQLQTCLQQAGLAAAAAQIGGALQHGTSSVGEQGTQQPQGSGQLQQNGVVGQAGNVHTAPGGGVHGAGAWGAVQQLVIYGLGSPLNSRTSRYQVRPPDEAE